MAVADLSYRASARVIVQAPLVFARSKRHVRAECCVPPPTLGVHVALPWQVACALAPFIEMEQRPNDTRCESRLSKARSSERSSTPG